MDNVTFIKLPLYVSDFLRYRYKAGKARGIRLPETAHLAGRILYERLVANPQMLPVSTISYCDRAMSAERDLVPPDMRGGLPTEDSRRFMCAFYIADEHLSQWTYIGSNDTMQLLTDDAKEFQDIVEKEMWDDLDRFRETEWGSWAQSLHYRTDDFQNMLGCWFSARDMNMDNYDAMLRVYRRDQDNKGLTKHYKPRASLEAQSE